MIHELRLSLGPVPAWILFQGSPQEAASRGTVLFLHGYSASKESHGPELWSLASRGFLAVGLDAPGHGERRYPDFDARFAGTGPAFMEVMLEVVRQGAIEIPGVVDVLRAALAPRGPLGLVGISMGALCAWQVPLHERRLDAMVCLLGTPRWQGHAVAPDSPHLRPQLFYPLAILSQSAELDQSVPPENTRRFHRELEPWYAAAPHRLRYVEHAGAGHFLPEGQWRELWGLTLDWLERYLP